MPGTRSGLKPGTDKPTRRVVCLILLLVVVAACLHGYLPGHGRALRSEPGNDRAALLLIVAALASTSALLAIAVIARLRDPRAVAPRAGDLSGMLGGGAGRPSWRVVLIGVGVIVAWVLVAMLLTRLSMPHSVGPPAAAPDSAPPSSAPGGAPPQKLPPQRNSGGAFGVLLAAAIPVSLLLVVAAAIMSRRRRKATAGILSEADVESPAPTGQSESLARAAEVGLAEMTDPRHEPREAIIACYAAMERELANVPDAAPQDFDTPTEVLARAVDHHALHADNAIELVNLFAEARFSPHVMNEAHREVAARVLRLVLDELRSASSTGGSS